MFNPSKSSRRASLPINTKKYEKFRGVDFSADITKVDSSRSPSALNIISDEGGNPVKRMGYYDSSIGTEEFIPSEGQTSFQTSQIAVPNSPIVTVDGVETEDYTLSVSDNKYTFSGVLTPGTGKYNAWYDNNKEFIESFLPQTGTNIINAPPTAKYLRCSVYDNDLGASGNLRVAKGVEVPPTIQDLTVYKSIPYAKYPTNTIYEQNGELNIIANHINSANVVFNCGDISSYKYVYIRAWDDGTGNATIRVKIGSQTILTVPASQWNSSKYIPIPTGASGVLVVALDCPNGNYRLAIQSIKLTGATIQEGNLFKTYTANKYLDNLGVEQTDAVWNLSDYIPITPARCNLTFATPPNAKVVLTYPQYIGVINGIFEYNGIVVHSGTNLYHNAVLIRSGVADNKSTSFTFNNKLYILTGTEYLVYDGTICSLVTSNTYTPTTKILDNETFQPVNLLSTHRKNKFTGDGVNKVFYLDAIPDTGSTILVTVNDVNVTAFTQDATDKKKITLTNAYTAANPVGTANITIEYIRTVAGHADNIKKCTFATVYANRVFFSGNPDKPSYDWASGVNDPTYIPDVSYTGIGNNSTPVMGYLKMGEDLGIVKSDGIYLRTNLFTADGYIFPVKDGVDIGAVSKSMTSLVDDPLFINSQGVYAIGNNAVTYEKSVQKRSSLVDARLTKEDLKNAISCVWNDYYLLFTNGNVYVADSRQKTYTNNATGTFEYEWYFWDNIPARCVCVSDGLYFGTEDGKVMKFYTNSTDIKSYNDNGQAIIAEWSTPLEDDKDFMTFKTMIKKGSGVFLKCFNRSSVKILVRTEKDFGREINTSYRIYSEGEPEAEAIQYNTFEEFPQKGENGVIYYDISTSKSYKWKGTNLGIFNFVDTDFENFTFNTSEQYVVPLNAKIKNYKYIQVILRNDQPNEGFGVFSIIRRYTTGNFVKENK